MKLFVTTYTSTMIISYAIDVVSHKAGQAKAERINTVILGTNNCATIDINTHAHIRHKYTKAIYSHKTNKVNGIVHVLYTKGNKVNKEYELFIVNNEKSSRCINPGKSNATHLLDRYKAIDIVGQRAVNTVEISELVCTGRPCINGEYMVEFSAFANFKDILGRTRLLVAYCYHKESDIDNCKDMDDLYWSITGYRII